MVNNFTPKNPKIYECIKCNFITSNKKDYTRHLTTAKHQMIKNDNKKNPKKPQSYLCLFCDKEFKYQSGQSRHMKVCKASNKYYSNDEKIVQQEQPAIENMNTVVGILKQNQEFKELMVEQSKQMKEIQQKLQNQQNENQNLQKQLIEAVKDGKTINNTINNNNQRFNLNFFLNTTCKDAMNMSEFIENIEVEFKDIENIGKDGYVSGMTNMILSRIRDLDVTKRPLHCTDLKRETMYIKDNDEWSKDTPENSKLRRMIDCVAKQNYSKIPLWRQQHPECEDWNNPKYDFCIDMMRNVLGDMGDEQIRLDNKVIKNLSKHIIVDK